MKCGNCNREIDELTVCPYCGFDNAPDKTAGKKKKSGTKPGRTGNKKGSVNIKPLLQIGFLVIILSAIILGGMSLFNSFEGESAKKTG